MPPHGFMAQSPQAHPYMWGVQVILLTWVVSYILVLFACHYLFFILLSTVPILQNICFEHFPMLYLVY